MFQPFKNLAYYLAMFLKVFVIDEDIIHIDRYLSFSYEVCEYRIHEGLEGGGTVGHAEIHDLGFVQSAIGYYHTLPFISFAYANVVIPPSDIELSEVFR